MCRPGTSGQAVTSSVQLAMLVASTGVKRRGRTRKPSRAYPACCSEEKGVFTGLSIARTLGDSRPLDAGLQVRPRRHARRVPCAEEAAAHREGSLAAEPPEDVRRRRGEGGPVHLL